MENLGLLWFVRIMKRFPAASFIGVSFLLAILHDPVADGSMGAAANQVNNGIVTVEVGPRQLNAFVPDQTFGADVDGQHEGHVDRIYTEKNLREMKPSGLSPLSYRLRTELAIDAWHWNETGSCVIAQEPVGSELLILTESAIRHPQVGARICGLSCRLEYTQSLNNPKAAV